MGDNRIRVGVFFGGSSREREVSFAGGRTVYDNLDKSLFSAVPIFVDHRGTFIKLDWQFIYRGTIRDFYPPVSYLPPSPNAFQIYGDSLIQTESEHREMCASIGTIIPAEELVNHMDIAFLALHGSRGEDGTIQGVLEWMNIPYTGSSILPSALGMNKAVQKRWMNSAGFDGPGYSTVSRGEWEANPTEVLQQLRTKVGFPLVVKAANQGSSIGIRILHEDEAGALEDALQHAFFSETLHRDVWSKSDKRNLIARLADIRSSIGFPMLINGEEVHHPEEAMSVLDQLFRNQSSVVLGAIQPETEVVVEQFIRGREFSCIVVRNHHGQTAALPPTEIVKRDDFFDYRSKYLPGLSRKITPIDLPLETVEAIRTESCRLYDFFGFQVYARIDGFYTHDGRIFLNDPNTTSGMMPSSFFFHQASEIGLNPSQFLTFILRTSIQERLKLPAFVYPGNALLTRFDDVLRSAQTEASAKIRVAVVMGGYSTERHISVESGRNIFEKLSSSAEYEPIPIFLTGSDAEHRLFRLPVNIMLKDNADDIAQKLTHFHQSDVLKRIIAEFTDLTAHYTEIDPIFEPQELSYTQLAELVDEVFIALHGRPGEDGAIQAKLEEVGLPYNGSGQASSGMTIDKFATNNLLRENGFLVADNFLIEEDPWRTGQANILQQIQSIGYPVIAKPSDEGCSSAVKKLDSPEELIQYAELTFRSNEELSSEQRQEMGLDDKEEFPRKPYFLVESCIGPNGADHFLEITGGMLTHHRNGVVEYEVFEPSEALAEGAILSLAEKFLAGEGQNITPARFDSNAAQNAQISQIVRSELKRVAEVLNVEGYCRIDAFVRIYNPLKVEVIIIEVNSLPGMTPATCIYHQAAINGYKPFEFIDKILTFGRERLTDQAS